MDPIDSGEILVILLGQCLILAELVPVWQVSSNIETLNHITLHSLWREAPQAGRQLKRSQNGPWNWSDTRGSFPAREQWKLKVPLRWKEAELPRRLSKEPTSDQLSGRSLYPLRLLERTFSNLLSHLQAVQFLQVTSIWSCQPSCVGFGNAAVFESFLLMWVTTHPHSYK